MNDNTQDDLPVSEAPAETKKLGPYKRAVAEATERAGNKRREEEGLVLFEYPDYETYRDVQTAGNKAKLKMQFVKEGHVERLSAYLTETLGEVSFGVCHGTRRGAEQTWFKTHLPGTPEIIGTEISDTAAEFPDTIQWDFHDVNPDWTGKADFVYSNSWDHAFDPVKAFSAWIDALRPGGVMLLDYTKGQTPEATNPLDPFGVTRKRLVQMLNKDLGKLGKVKEQLNFRMHKDYRATVVVYTKK